MPFHDFVLPRVFFHPRTSGGQRRPLRAAAVSSLEEWVSGTGHFRLLLKMHVDEIFMKCQQEISKHASTHLHVRTLLAQNPERVPKMTGMHPRTPGWGVGGAAIFQLRVSYGRCSRRCSNVLSLALFCMFVPEYLSKHCCTPLLSHSPCSKT